MTTPAPRWAVLAVLATLWIRISALMWRTAGVVDIIERRLVEMARQVEEMEKRVRKMDERLSNTYEVDQLAERLDDLENRLLDDDGGSTREET